jgi:hypothetical protein
MIPNKRFEIIPGNKFGARFGFIAFSAPLLRLRAKGKEMLDGDS